ncbi:response regulator transcription factor [Schumannella soli]|uniref:Response regulator transcription factor n=1 Tax=Schumannella soli TaxID=2590779 RepID=A0A506XZY7_9MICO|nr:response regulator transcription factor [Schumannella soli]TPW74787.1 response regulator transcription factor [Schumannella soli]
MSGAGSTSGGAVGGADAAAGGAPRIRVLVADDQAIVRDGIVTVLGLEPDIEIVGEAADGAQAVELATSLAPDVVLMDLRMPVLDGAAATERLRESAPKTAVLVLTTYADDASIMGALRAGARGYLTKDAGRAEIAAAVRAVRSGQTTLAAEVGARLIGGLTAPAGSRGRDGGDSASANAAGMRTVVEPPASAAGPAAGAGSGSAAAPDPLAALRAREPELTAREAEVALLMAEGLANPEIAGRLFVSTATVKTHVNAIFGKLLVATRAQAIARLRP